MKTIAILAPSRRHLMGFLAVNPWINPDHVVQVESEHDLVNRVGMVLALRGWENSPSIARPRAILEQINASDYLQLVVLEMVYVPMTTEPLKASKDVATDRIEIAVQYDDRTVKGYQPIDRGGKVLPPPRSR